MSDKGYILAEVDVYDAEAYQEYVKLAGIASTKYGAHYLSRGQALECLEGEVEKLPRIAILQFDSVDRAREFYFSPEYTNAKAKRTSVAKMKMLLLAGI